MWVIAFWGKDEKTNLDSNINNDMLLEQDIHIAAFYMQ
jgi:hypothetical protein